MSKPALPVLDISPLLGSSSSVQRASLLNELREISHTIGFFYIKNHGVEEAFVQQIFDVARKFFELPTEVKEECCNLKSRHFRGWESLGQERTMGKVDLREQIDIGLELPPVSSGSEVTIPHYLNLIGPNLWPPSEHLPAFRPTVDRFFAEMRHLAAVLLAALAESVGLDPETFQGTMSSQPHNFMKICRYPSSSDYRQGVGEHSDYGYLTILLQDDKGGLQVKTMDGEWVDATPLPGTFIINLGEMLQLATGNYFLATPHRVMSNTSGVDRISIPFFYNPSLDAVVKPLKIKLPGEENETHYKATPSLQAGTGALIDDVYGVNAFKGFSRAHPQIFQKYYATA
eukprot:Colp12_sorted_trinity150504_noHs@19411